MERISSRISIKPINPHMKLKVHPWLTFMASFRKRTLCMIHSCIFKGLWNVSVIWIIRLTFLLFLTRWMLPKRERLNYPLIQHGCYKLNSDAYMDVESLSAVNMLQDLGTNIFLNALLSHCSYYSRCETTWEKKSLIWVNAMSQNTFSKEDIFFSFLLKLCSDFKKTFLLMNTTSFAISFVSFSLIFSSLFL